MSANIDTRTFKVVMPTCPLCQGKWVYYDGALGYESLICEVCRFDINEIKVVAE